MYKVLIAGRMNGQTIRQLRELKDSIILQSDKEITIEFVDTSVVSQIELDQLQDFVRRCKPKNKDALLMKLELMKGRV